MRKKMRKYVRRFCLVENSCLIYNLYEETRANFIITRSIRMSILFYFNLNYIFYTREIIFSRFKYCLEKVKVCL